METRPLLPQSLPTVQVAKADSRPLDPAIRDLLAPGAVLDVTVVRAGGQPGQRDGIVLGTTFIPAALTPDLEAGERVSVQVVKTEPTIVLRLVSLEPATRILTDSSLLETALQALLTQDDVGSLRSSLRPIEREVGSPLATFLASLPTAKSDTPGMKEVAARLEYLLKQHFVIDEPTAAQPEKLAAALARFFPLSPAETAAQSIEAGVRAAARSVRDLELFVAQSKEIPGAVKFIDTLSAQLKALLTLETPLAFDSAAPVPPEIARGNIELFLAASHYAIAAGRTHSFEAISRQITALNAAENPLAALLRALGTLTGEARHGDSPLLIGFARAADELGRDLSRLRLKQAGDDDIRTALNAAAQKLEALMRSEKPKAAEASLLLKGAEILRDLERTAEGQDILRFLAPLAQGLSEPAGMVFPMIIHGLLTKFEVSFWPAPHRLDPEDPEQSGSAGDLFQRFGFSVRLPALGPIRVDGAHRPGEILLNITCEEGPAADFITAHLSKLEALLEQLGCSRRTIAARTGAVRSAAPEWSRALTRSAVVA